MSPRLQQLLDGFSNSGDHSHILLNSNIQKFLKKFEEKFAKGSEMIFSPKFRKTLLQCLGKFKIEASFNPDVNFCANNENYDELGADCGLEIMQLHESKVK